MKSKMLLALAVLLFSCTAQATLNDKNVILVHGLLPINPEPPLDPAAKEAEAINAAKLVWQGFWLSKAEGVLHWPADGRISGKISDVVKKQIKALEADRTCSEGCVFVTHSAGDLVMRYALSKLNQWEIDPEKFSVVAVIDLAGAGGGTELADVAYNAAMNDNSPENKAHTALTKSTLTDNPTPETIGVIADLRPAVAYSIASQGNETPRLRFVGTGRFPGFSGFAANLVANTVIKGRHDGIVPLHSACGATNNGSFKSCSRSIRINGEIRRSKGPFALRHNHYPVLMGEKTNHVDIIGDKPSGYFATVTNDVTIGGLELDFNATTRKRWRSWWYRNVRIIQDKSKSMSRTIYETLDN